MAEELDLSWIQDEEKILSGVGLEPETIKQIRLMFIYINQNDYIDSVKQSVKILDNHSTISVNELLAIIQKHKLSTPTSKYKIIDLLLFHVDLPLESIKQQESLTVPSLKSIGMIHDIILKPSILVFHNLNTIYFIFKEFPLVYNSMTRSILKPQVVDDVPKQARTKRVKMNMYQVNRHTRKQLDDHNQ